MIVDRAKTCWDDFDFSIWIKDGTPHFIDLVGYWDDGEYRERTPEESFALVRKWWDKEKGRVEFDEEVMQAKEQLDIAQSNLKKIRGQS
jgi:hypothetical protein